MQRLLVVTLVCLINLVCLIEEAHSLPWPPEVDVYYIKFNYQSGYSNDALDIRKNYSTDISVPEWKPSISRNEKIAYIKSQSGRKIKAKFWVDREDFDRMVIYAERSSGQGIGEIFDTGVQFNGSQYSNETVMTGDGSVPSSVGQRGFKWKWYVLDIDDYILEEPLWIGDTGTHYYYTLLGAPQSPMPEPWTEVLNYACDWAFGKTSESAVLEKITYWAYVEFGKDHEYDGSDSHAYGTTFHLTSFFFC